jgi:hypothetical protein
MGFLRPPSIPAPIAPPPPPRIDEAQMRARERYNTARRGQAATVLTSESGLPNLGGLGPRSQLYNGRGGGISGGVG